jgi:hypothetical protein
MWFRKLATPKHRHQRLVVGAEILGVFQALAMLMISMDGCFAR